MVKRIRPDVVPGGPRPPAGSAGDGSPPGDAEGGKGAGGSTLAEESPGAEQVRRLLLEAYDTGKRDLPWRGESDPYRIWVAEVMLQQTRVETVLPYYKRWLQRFPSLEALAAAREEDVLLAWQGLGYYSRARRLLGAARMIRERHEGHLPSKEEALRRLPGMGAYTAGAVASMAFGEAVPAVDGNVRRVLARVYDLPDPRPGKLRELAGALVDPDRPGDFNQALMELGATVCLPRSPRCQDCPLGGLCLANRRGTVAERPPRKARRPVPEIEMAVVVAVRAPGAVDASSRREAADGLGEEAKPAPRFLLRKRPGTGLLAGMWEFPEAEVPTGRSARDAALELAGDLGLNVVGEPQELKVVRHLFSHLKVRYRPFVLLVARVTGLPPGAWLHMDELPGVPLPVAQRKIAQAAGQVVQDPSRRL
jgi:A/G-specific adenine glycosylase